MEYASALYTAAAKSHLNRLEVVQKKAARIILGYPRDAHAEPLMQSLHLDSLSNRREIHIRKIVEASIAGSNHPMMKHIIRLGADNKLIQDVMNTGYGRKSFSYAAADLMNK